MSYMRSKITYVHNHFITIHRLLSFPFMNDYTHYNQFSKTVEKVNKIDFISQYNYIVSVF